MIQVLSERFRYFISMLLLITFYSSIVLPAYADRMRSGNIIRELPHFYSGSNKIKELPEAVAPSPDINVHPDKTEIPAEKSRILNDIGGPGQPEMSSFKSVGADNMVNLFTGDFNYNIPLMDVGGYPINIFYDGSVGVEQEASWVGLGWNINPGNINRNMRGVPDDFNGDELQVQSQKMKRNKTWGVNLGADGELIGIKSFFGLSIDASLGMSFNNYLGPALDLGIKGGANFKIASKSKPEKAGDTTSASIGVSVGANLNSRSGVTLSPSVSLSAGSFLTDSHAKSGGQGTFGLSTSYNSRVGIKSLQIYGQASFSKTESACKQEEGNRKNPYSSSIGQSLLSTSISFSKPSYTPSIRIPVTNEAFSGKFQLGGGVFGVHGSVEGEVYRQISEIADEDILQSKKMVGYLYADKAVNDANAVMDFTRLNDNQVDRNTPIISVPQYTYDVFSIQGEGTGGSIRLYRNDLMYVRDNLTQSRDKSLNIGFDISPPMHFGANASVVTTPTSIGDWGEGNKLRTTFSVRNATADNSPDREKVYFRNPGENSVINPNQYNAIGGLKLVRFSLGGAPMSPTIEPKLEMFGKDGYAAGFVDVSTASSVNERKKRTQVVSFLTAEEATNAALEKAIRSYNPAQPLNSSNDLVYSEIPREGNYRKKNHFSQITVTEGNGTRYVYGLPVYNLEQKDFTFSVPANPSAPSTHPDKVGFIPNEASTSSTLLNDNSSRATDGYVQISTTPAYAHSFLLSGLLSPDYVDVDGNGITENDYGNAVKFNYTNWGTNRWKTPLSEGNEANFNKGKLTETKDDKGIISTGQRESWYVHSIESKSMIAIFTLENRKDGKGSVSELGGIDAADNTQKRLKKIDLYNKADLKKNGLGNNGAKPIKTVWFEYSYNLCKGTPDNTDNTETGKLTLEKIYFTFNGQQRVNVKNQYVFSYVRSAAQASVDNPDYSFGATDRWGTYKHASSNPSTPSTLLNSVYPYSVQDKTTADNNAGAWSLKKILLPSGGRIDIEYESDDYAFVQNKRACNMMEIAGFGTTPSLNVMNNKLYEVAGNAIIEKDYVFIKVPENYNMNPINASDKPNMYKKYLEGQKQLAFKLAVNMPKGVEYIPCYAEVDATGDWYGISNSNTIWVKLKRVDDIGALSLTAIEFLRELLPGQAFAGYDIPDGSGLQQIGDLLISWLDALKGAFKNPVEFLRSTSGDAKAQTVVLGHSFVRLNNPTGLKFGGGQRVKTVKLRDNWERMTGQYTSEYGQTYDYKTTEVLNGTVRTISSGVASYEPSMGGEENPFQTIVQVANKLPMGPASYSAVEMPVLDAFFPSPMVGYSKVTVTSVRKSSINPTTTKSRSGIGKQVTEFFTAKDYPVQYQHTPFDPASDKCFSQSSFGNFFYKFSYDSRTLSQGFLVETNDMHGKMKSQASFAEGNDETPVNFTRNYYRNTGDKGLDEKFDFVNGLNGGTVAEGNMGIDVELMIDTREFIVKSNNYDVQGQADGFPVIIPAWIPFIWPVSAESENIYRAVTTTKVISYHSIVDSVVVIDKGSQVSTSNILYDAETGEVIVNRTANEYKLPVYSTSYPAYWAYSGMGLAYKNIDLVYTASFNEGKISGIPASYFESGDELMVLDPGTDAAISCPVTLSSPPVDMLWAFDKDKNNSSLFNSTPDFIFIDAKGRLCHRNNVKFRIIRSGKRNLLDAKVASFVTRENPVSGTGNNRQLVINNDLKVISATAVNFNEKWHSDNDVFRKYVYSIAPCTTEMIETPSCAGIWEIVMNPYQKALLGNFKSWKNYVFYGNRSESDPSNATNLPANGFLSDFGAYWNFNSAGHLIEDASNEKWISNEQKTLVNIKGLDLETRNALDIYSSAQYGFNRTIPVAVVNNARYNDIGYEGFEDAAYNEDLSQNNGTWNQCPQKHFSLSNMGTNAPIVDARVEQINAHTGVKMMKLLPGQKALAGIPIRTAEVQDFTFPNVTQSEQVLTNPGGTLTFSSAWPNGFATTPTFTTSDFGMNLISGSVMINTLNTNPISWGYENRVTQYLKINSTGNYTFRLWTTNPLYFTAYRNRPTMVIYLQSVNSAGGISNVTPTSSIDNPGSSIYNFDKNVEFCLTPGNYRVITVCTNGKVSACVCDGDDECNSESDEFHMNLLSTGFISYKNLQSAGGCTAQRPIPAIPDMMNPVFSFVPGKDMHMSAWVRQNCPANTTDPCGYITIQPIDFVISTDFTANQIPLLPKGPVIDGWQRVEANFKMPDDPAKCKLVFHNDGTTPVYFDDIRIHPFNANMKSYAYDPVSLRLVAELDDNNYATFYEYDEEGQLVRVKKETVRGIQTISETRSAKQTQINDVN